MVVNKANANSDSLITGSYAQGAYGPTIHLVLNSSKSVDWLHELFMNLVQGESGIDLVAMPEVSIEHVGTLKMDQVAMQPEIALVNLSTGNQGADFQWSQDAEHWRTTAMLLEPFLAGGKGHQYLTHEGRDAALIEVAFQE